MPDPAPTPFAQTLRWLTDHAGFPWTRLPAKAELLLLVATAAADEELEQIKRESTQPGRDRNFEAKLRNYTMLRRRVHIKSDNSAKV